MSRTIAKAALGIQNLRIGGNNLGSNDPDIGGHP